MLRTVGRVPASRRFLNSNAAIWTRSAGQSATANMNNYQFALSTSRNIFTNPNTHSGPSPTTTVLLRNLPASVTEAQLTDAVQVANITGCRKVQLEPGCSLHFTQEHEAQTVADIFKKKFNFKTYVSSATLPCLALRNLPGGVTVEALSEKFAAFDPVNVIFSGQLSVQISIDGASAALSAAKALSSLSFAGQQLKVASVSVGRGRYLLTAYNIAPAADRAAVDAAVTQALQGASVQAQEVKFVSHQESKVVTHLAAPGSAAAAAASGPSLDIDEDYITRVQSALAKAFEDTDSVTVTVKRNMAKPALFVRQLAHVKDPARTFPQLLESASGLERVQYLRDFADRPVSMAVLYFQNSDAAQAALAKLHGTVVDGRRISVAYREAKEPGLRISNLPPQADAAEVAKLFPPSINVIRLHVHAQRQEAVAILDSPHHADIAAAALNNTRLGQNRLKAAPTEVGDVGIEVRAVGDGAPTEAELKQRIKDCFASNDLRDKGCSFSSNSSAFISFKKLQQAMDARTFLLDKKSGGGGSDEGALFNSSSSDAGVSGPSGVSAEISVAPSHVLEVSNVPTDTSVQQLVDAIDEDAFEKSMIIHSDRSALVKFRRHREVVPGMKALKQLQYQGADDNGASGAGAVASGPMRVVRYRPLQSEGSSEYDLLDYGSRVAPRTRSTMPMLSALMDAGGLVDDDDDAAEAALRGAANDVQFDRLSMKSMLENYLDSDPALRYKIAKNSFERALYDAKAIGDASLIIGPEMSPEVQAEARELLTGSASRTAGKSEEEINHRLFEIFMQKKDMERFTNDLMDFEALFGPADESDNLNWSQFHLESDEDIVRIKEQLARADEIALQEMVANMQNRAFKLSDLEEGDEAAIDEGGGLAGAADEVGKGGKKAGKTVRSVNVLVKGDTPDADTMVNVAPPGVRDRDGFLWSACILDTDMVQKTMPGNRVNTHRALVVVGNLKGAGGFGMGKGKTGADAVNAACRSALRNLTHVDLYDNFGLAHDLYGKHNSCHAYIRATPNSRRMVASPLATEVLTRFGISSASVKMKGRRNPYSQVRAIFNALANHQNIDEFAKDRGKRYLTLRWAYEHNA